MCDPQQAKQSLKILKKTLRQALPASAFCGPNRTMSCYNAEHTRRSLILLSMHKKYWKLGVYLKMTRCVIRRAKKFDVPISPELAEKLSVEKLLNVEPTEPPKPFVFR